MSAGILFGLPAMAKTLLDRLTQVRADYLDNLAQLDAQVTSRASNADMQTLLSRVSPDVANHLDSMTMRWGPVTYELISYDGDLNESVGVEVPGEIYPVDVESEVLNLTGPGVIYTLYLKYAITRRVGVRVVADGVTLYENPNGTDFFSELAIGLIDADDNMQAQATPFLNSFQVFVTPDGSDSGVYEFKANYLGFTF